MFEAVPALMPTRDAAGWLVLAAAVFSGGALRGLTGFGAALVMAPVLSTVISARETVCLVTLLSALPMGQGLSTGAVRVADRALVAPMVAAAALGVPAGLWLIAVLPAYLFRPLIGLAVVGSAAALLGGFTLARRRSLRLSLGVGALSGLLTGIGGVGGPPAILYVLGVEPDAHRARACFIVFFACLYPVALAALVATGLLGWPEVVQGLLFAPLFHVGGVVGERLYRLVSTHHFRPFVLLLLMATGLLAALPRNAAAGAHEPQRTTGGPEMVRRAPVQCTETAAIDPATAKNIHENNRMQNRCAPRNAGIRFA